MFVKEKGPSCDLVKIKSPLRRKGRREGVLALTVQVQFPASA